MQKAGKIDLFRHAFNPPSWPYIEPFKDAQTDALRLAKCLISPRRLHAESGREWTEIVDETVEDNGYAISAALTKAAEINKAFPDANVQWRDVLSLPTPEVKQLPDNSGPAGPDNAPKKKKGADSAAA